jgi:hypothetical protein
VGAAARYIRRRIRALMRAPAVFKKERGRRLRKGTVDELWRQSDQLRMTRVMRPYWDAIAS